MLGRLREEEHDPGELAFLEATECFHSKHYIEAIEHARNVSSTAKDWPRALMLILESHAYCGDVEALNAELEAVPDFVFPEFFIPYIYQVAIENSDIPETYFESAMMIVSDVGSGRPPVHEAPQHIFEI